jgi:fibronectin-binding autotransporter adhesin
MMASWNARILARTAIVLILCTGVPPRAMAAQVADTWLGGTGSWGNHNWSIATGSGFPSNGSPSGTTYSAFIDNANVAVSDVSLGGSVTVDDVSVSSGDTLEIINSSNSTGVLTIPTYSGAGMMSNAGTIKLRVTGGTGVPTLMIDGTGVASPMATLSGGGVVTMTSGTMISGVVGTETLTSNNSISGAGTIGGLNFINHGTINANISSATLNITPTATMANAGTGPVGSGFLEATGGGILALGAGTFDNTDPTFPGTISASGGSTVEFGTSTTAGTIIKGGTLSTDASSTIENFHVTTLKDLALSSGTRYVQPDGATTNLQGTITNGGVITLLTLGSAATVLQLNDGDVTLGGTGSITLDGYSVAGNDPNLLKIQGVSNPAGLAPRLTIGANQTVSGVGQIGSFSTTLSPKLTNHGTITASTLPPNITPAGITIFPLSGADALINDGTLAADDNNAVLTLSGGTVTNFSPSSLGTIVAHGHNLSGMLSFERGVTVNGGTIVLDGPLSGLQLNSAAALASTVTNTTGGTITTIASSTGNTLGGAITNSGGSTIVAAANSTLSIQPSGAGFANSATLRAASGSTLGVTGGYMQTGGDTNVVGTLTVSGGPLVVSGGTLSGGGITNINAGLSLAGSVTKLDSGTVTVVGPQNHSAGASLAVNGGRVKFNITSGTSVAVGSGVSVTVAAGATLELSGAAAALSAGINRATVANSSVAPGILVSGTHQQVGNINGAGSTSVNPGSDLTANHILQSTLIIGGTIGNPAVVTIASSNAAGQPSATSGLDAWLALDGSKNGGAASASLLSMGAADFGSDTITVGWNAENRNGVNAGAVPEPATWLLLSLGVAALLRARRAGRLTCALLKSR